MKSKIILSILIVFVIILFVLVNITFASDNPNQISSVEEFVMANSYGIFEAFACFMAAAVGLGLRYVVQR